MPKPALSSADGDQRRKWQLDSLRTFLAGGRAAAAGPLAGRPPTRSRSTWPCRPRGLGRAEPGPPPAGAAIVGQGLHHPLGVGEQGAGRAGHPGGGQEGDDDVGVDISDAPLIRRSLELVALAVVAAQVAQRWSWAGCSMPSAPGRRLRVAAGLTVA
jgi:hypothetical protein